MSQESAGPKEWLVTIRLPDALAQRLKLAATRSQRPGPDVILDLLDRNLPRLQDPKKKVPYT